MNRKTHPSEKNGDFISAQFGFDVISKLNQMIDSNKDPSKEKHGGNGCPYSITMIRHAKGAKKGEMDFLFYCRKQPVDVISTAIKHRFNSMNDDVWNTK